MLAASRVLTPTEPIAEAVAVPIGLQVEHRQNRAPRLSVASSRGSNDSARKAIGVLVQKFHWGNDNLRVKRMSTVARTEVVTCTQPFAPQREIFTRLELSAGKYVIVPMTYSPRTGGRYWVTVLSTAKVSDGAIACAARTAGVDMCVPGSPARARARRADLAV